jgi:hypothetical protein
MAFPFQALVNMEKAISGSPKWSKPDGADQIIRLSASLEVNGNTLQGFFLKGRARANQPSSDISFTLTYLPPGQKRGGVTLERIDWRPLTPHTNTDPSSPHDLYLLELPGTHWHSFELNWRSQLGRPLKWVPVACPISPDFQSFADLRAGVGNRFRISNIGLIPEPDWVKVLL